MNCPHCNAEVVEIRKTYTYRDKLNTRRYAEPVEDGPWALCQWTDERLPFAVPVPPAKRHWHQNFLEGTYREHNCPFGDTRKPLKRSPMKRTRSKPKRRAVSPASVAQREKVRDQPCIVCGVEGVHPAHLIDRSLGGDDDPRAVVALCPTHHRQFDEQGLDLSPYLEPNHRAEAAYAVELIGLERAYRRITNAGRG